MAVLSSERSEFLPPNIAASLLENVPSKAESLIKIPFFIIIVRFSFVPFFVYTNVLFSSVIT